MPQKTKDSKAGHSVRNPVHARPKRNPKRKPHRRGSLVPNVSPLDRRAIKEIELKDFQGHRQTTISLGNITAITGESDAGKSAIMRAVQWARTNRPLGKAFIRKGANETTVDIRLVNKESVQRLKAAKGVTNQYIVNDGEPDDAVKTEVPSEVLELVPPDLNVQTQFDPPFMLSMSPGQRTTYLSGIVGLEQMDRAMANLESWRRATTSSITNAENSIKDLQEQLVEQNTVEQAREVMVDLQKKIGRLKKLWRAKTLINEIEEMQKKLKAMPDLEKAQAILDRAKEKWDKARALKDKLHVLEQYLEQHKNVSARLKKMEDEYDKVMPNICPLCGSKLK